MDYLTLWKGCVISGESLDGNYVVLDERYSPGEESSEGSQPSYEITARKLADGNVYVPDAEVIVFYYKQAPADSEPVQELNILGTLPKINTFGDLLPVKKVNKYFGKVTVTYRIPVEHAVDGELTEETLNLIGEKIKNELNINLGDKITVSPSSVLPDPTEQFICRETYQIDRESLRQKGETDDLPQ